VFPDGTNGRALPEVQKNIYQEIFCIPDKIYEMRTVPRNIFVFISREK
jgi:hypothetical protein